MTKQNNIFFKHINKNNYVNKFITIMKNSISKNHISLKKSSFDLLSSIIKLPKDTSRYINGSFNIKFISENVVEKKKLSDNIYEIKKHLYYFKLNQDGLYWFNDTGYKDKKDNLNFQNIININKINNNNIILYTNLNKIKNILLIYFSNPESLNEFYTCYNYNKNTTNTINLNKFYVTYKKKIKFHIDSINYNFNYFINFYDYNNNNEYKINDLIKNNNYNNEEYLIENDLRKIINLN